MLLIMISTTYFEILALVPRKRTKSSFFARTAPAMQVQCRLFSNPLACGLLVRPSACSFVRSPARPPARPPTRPPARSPARLPTRPPARLPARPLALSPPARSLVCPPVGPLTCQAACIYICSCITWSPHFTSNLSYIIVLWLINWRHVLHYTKT